MPFIDKVLLGIRAIFGDLRAFGRGVVGQSGGQNLSGWLRVQCCRAVKNIQRLDPPFDHLPIALVPLIRVRRNIDGQRKRVGIG